MYLIKTFIAILILSLSFNASALSFAVNTLKLPAIEWDLSLVGERHKPYVMFLNKLASQQNNFLLNAEYNTINSDDNFNLNVYANWEFLLTDAINESFNVIPNRKIRDINLNSVGGGYYIKSDLGDLLRRNKSANFSPDFESYGLYICFDISKLKHCKALTSNKGEILKVGSKDKKGMSIPAFLVYGATVKYWVEVAPQLPNKNKSLANFEKVI